MKTIHDIDLNISPTLMRSVLPNDACGQYLKYRFIDKIEIEPSDAMLKGRLFEFLLLGVSSHKDEMPELPKLKRGGISKAEQDLKELVTYANIICDNLGIDIAGGEKQLVLLDGDLKGIIDLLTNDIQQKGRKAIYDFKYAETKYDDRWNGWADFDNKLNEKNQARHYINLYHKKHGVYLPYYFIIFGKSFWCRIVKVVVTQESMVMHERVLQMTREKIEKLNESGWAAMPEFMKCQACDYNSICKSVSTLPTIEYYEV